MRGFYLFLVALLLPLAAAFATPKITDHVRLQPVYLPLQAVEDHPDYTPDEADILVFKPQKGKSHKLLQKARLRTRGVENPFITYTQNFVAAADPVRIIISGIAAYTQPYRLSLQYSYLFRLTPF